MKIGDKLLSDIYVAPAWSISAEVFLYLLYVPLANFLYKMRTGTGSVIGFFLLIASGATAFRCSSWWLNQGYPQYVIFYMSPLCRLPEFLLGALTAALYNQRARKPTRWFERGTLLIAGAVTAAAVFAGCYTKYADRVDLLTYSWGFAPFCAAMLYYLVRNRSVLSRLVENRLILLLGNASYSIYLLSGFSFVLFANNGPSPNYAVAAYRELLSVVFLFITSLGVYQYLEVPARRLIRRLAQARPLAAQAAPSGAATVLAASGAEGQSR